MSRARTRPGREKLYTLEMARAVAACLVVFFHTQIIVTSHTGRAPFAGLFGAGNRGVDLFFVLSGFIITYVNADDLGRPRRLGRYLFSRASRILPALWIVSLAALALYAIGFGSHAAAKLDPGAILAGFLLLPQAGEALVNVSWTLKYEAFFYLIFAIQFLNLRIGLFLLITWQAAVAIVALTGADLGLLPGYYLRGICLEFGVGLVCAWWLRRSDGFGNAGAAWTILALGVFAFGSGMVLDQVSRFSGALCTLGAAAILVSLVSLERTGRLSTPRLMMRLGSASYAIYLVHFSVLVLLAQALTRLGMQMGSGEALLIAVIAILVGLAFDELIDQPLQRTLKRLGFARRRVSVPEPREQISSAPNQPFEAMPPTN